MRLPRPSGLPKRIPLLWWLRLKMPYSHKWLGHRLPAQFWVWRNWRLHGVVPDPPKPKPKPTRIYMYDDVNISLIPRTAKAVAGYVDGRWQTWLKLKLRCPLAKRVSIAVFPTDDADCLDCEPGDAANAQAPTWVKRQLRRRKNGIRYDTSLPALYTSAANGEALISVCTKAGLRYGIDYLWWSAHYDPRWGTHICHPGCYPGIKHTAHATQFTDHAGGKSLDESICNSTFFGG